MRCHVCTKHVIETSGTLFDVHAERDYDFCGDCIQKIVGYVGSLVSKHVSDLFQKELDKKKAEKQDGK